MGKYVLKRLAYMVVVFFITSLMMYAIYNLIPNDPARAQLEGQKKTMKPKRRKEKTSLKKKRKSSWMSLTN